MLRPLLTLGVGIALAVLLTALIAGGRSLAPVLGPILITTGLGALVLAVVARRARLRERAMDLDPAQNEQDPAQGEHDQQGEQDQAQGEHTAARDHTDKEPDRG